MNRRWFSLINIPVQVGLLMLFLAGFLSVILILGAFTWYCLSLFGTFAGALVSDPAVLDQTRAILRERAYVALGTLLIVLAIFSFLVLRMTNRVAGPLYRITEELRRIDRSGEIHEIQVREQDFYQGFVEVLNQLLRRAKRPGNERD